MSTSDSGSRTEVISRGGPGSLAEAIDGNGQTVAGIPLADVLRQVNLAFYVVANEPGSDLVPLKAVELTLNTVLEWTVSFGPKFKIPFFDIEVELGHEITRSQTHTIVIKLKRPAPLEGFAPPPDIPESLAEGLRTIRQTVQAAAAGEPPLVLDEGSLELQFGISHDSTAKLIVFSGEYQKAWTHTLSVIVGQPDQ
jgi:hypothetical protein